MRTSFSIFCALQERLAVYLSLVVRFGFARRPFSFPPVLCNFYCKNVPAVCVLFSRLFRFENVLAAYMTICVHHVVWLEFPASQQVLFWFYNS